MCEIQDVFNKVIDAGIYSEADDRGVSEFMCLALPRAQKAGCITRDESDLALRAVKDYMVHLCGDHGRSLSGVYDELDWGSSFDDTLRTYQNWDQRPMLHD